MLNAECIGVNLRQAGKLPLFWLALIVSEDAMRAAEEKRYCYSVLDPACYVVDMTGKVHPLVNSGPTVIEQLLLSDWI